MHKLSALTSGVNRRASIFLACFLEAMKKGVTSPFLPNSIIRLRVILFKLRAVVVLVTEGTRNFIVQTKLGPTLHRLTSILSQTSPVM